MPGPYSESLIGCGLCARYCGGGSGRVLSLLQEEENTLVHAFFPPFMHMQERPSIDGKAKAFLGCKASTQHPL